MQPVLRALAEPQRLKILILVRDTELSAGEIANHFTLTRPAISQHLRILTRAGLLTERRQGTRRLYRLRRRRIVELRRFLGKFWSQSLEDLKRAVEINGEDL